MKVRKAPARFIRAGLVVLLAGACVSVTSAQGGFGGAAVTNRLDTLAASLALTDLQKKEVKTILDDVQNTAAPVRARLAATRAAVGAAIQAGKNQTEIDAAIRAYAIEVTAMTGIEVHALGRVLHVLTEQQAADIKTKGIRTPFFLTRGMFLDDKKWNVAPSGEQGY